MKEIVQSILEESKNQAKLIVVSKKRSCDEILSYYNIGIRDFAENRVQDCLAKAKVLPQDIKWHFIGHLQRNKVAEILPVVSMIHSVESLALVDILEKEANKINKQIPILIQFNLAKEETKTGISKEEAIPFIEHTLTCPHLKIQGIMVMGPHIDEEEKIRRVFKEAHELLQELAEKYGNEIFHELSMGMSHDYKIALEEGSTLLRIGSILFE